MIKYHNVIKIDLYYTNLEIYTTTYKQYATIKALQMQVRIKTKDR